MKAVTTLLLAERDTLRGRFSDTWLRRLSRASVVPVTTWVVDESGADLPPQQWPLVSATFRQDTGGEIPDACVIRLDPAAAVPDINGIRMVAFGGMLHITEPERAAFAAALAPVLEPFGMQLAWPLPDRAYLLDRSQVPTLGLVPTSDVLGDDLLEHYPPLPQGKTWRLLINELQMALHDHPANLDRQRRGLQPVNLMWPWTTQQREIALREQRLVVSPDADWMGVWRLAGGDAHLRSDATALTDAAGVLIDLRDLRVCSLIERNWLDPLLESRNGRLDIQFGFDERLAIRPSQRLKFWRKSRS